MRTATLLLFAGALAFPGEPVQAQTNTGSGTQTQLQTEARTMDAAASRGQTRVQTRIASAFADFAGSETNARSLVTGLRQGSAITLTAPGTGGQPGSTTTFTPPTRPMGHGNVYISLALAREQLAQIGITQPTPEQLQAALTGGTITTGSGPSATTTKLQGVLQMRADGMGWGRIANTMGVKLGHVVSGMKHANQQIAATSPATVPASTGAGNGTTTAAGATPATAQARARGNSAAAHDANRSGAGIVNAAGGSSARVSAGTRIQGGSMQGAGVVSAAGAGVNANAGGQGLAKGHGKQ